MVVRRATSFRSFALSNGSQLALPKKSAASRVSPNSPLCHSLWTISVLLQAVTPTRQYLIRTV